MSNHIVVQRVSKKKHNKSQKTDNLNAGNNKPKNTKKWSLERVANETDEEMTPVLKRTKNDGNSPKNNHLSIDEDI